MSLDLFQEINDAVLDLQNSHFQTYQDRLNHLANLLRHEELSPYNQELSRDLDLAAFLDKSSKTGGSMVGSQTLAWPEDSKARLGISWLLIQKLGTDPGFATDFSITYYYSNNKIIGAVHDMVGQLIVPFVRDYKKFIHSRGLTNMKLKQFTSNKIFIVHGHDEAARDSVARFLEKLKLEVIILHEQANKGRTIIEKIEMHNDVGFAVVLLTPDDVGNKIGEAPKPRARQNVLLELGYFMGLLGRARVCALKKGNVDLPSDFAGVVWTEIDQNGAWKQALGKELKAADYAIDWNIIMG